MQKKLQNFFGVDHIFVSPENNLYKRLYRFYLTSQIDRSTYCESICKVCTTLVHSAGLNIAYEKKIPLVILGYSPDQAAFPEFSEEVILKSWVPKELFNEKFDEKDKSYFWNPENVDKKSIPRFVLPFYFLDYPGAENIQKALSDIGLMQKRNFDMLKTNCRLVNLLMRLDFLRYGYCFYVENICSLIRTGKIRSRRKYFLILTLGVWIFKYGFVKRKDIKHSLKYLDLKISDILK